MSREGNTWEGEDDCILAKLSAAWTVFACSNTRIVGSNPTESIDVSMSLFCVCVVLCVDSSLVTGWSPVQEVLPN
jgi:hypothetical protein